ncbi:magnetosome protein Mad22 [Candidatus Magnetomorum sp. HK-1]|nr:magnetosome protein Mad22 [Candidatus Magnetomorum sp. HK-1]
MSVSETSQISGNQKYNDLFVNIGSRLENMRNKQTLRMELIKLSKEIKYFDEKIINVRQKINGTLSNIELMKQKIVQPEQELQDLSAEKEQIEKDNENLKALEKTMADKLLLLPEIKSKMKLIRRDYESSQSSYYKIKEAHDALVADNKHIEKQILENKTKMDALSSEITVMKSTRDLLKGLVPDNFDQDTFEQVQVNQGETLELYIQDMKINMDMIKAEIKRLNSEKDQMKKQIEPIRKSIQENKTKISEISHVLGETKDLNAILEKSKHLKQELKLLPEKTQQMMTESNAFEIKIKKFDQQMVLDKKLESEYSERLEYLKKRKLQMDEIEDVEIGIQRLGKEILNDQKEKIIYQRLNQLTKSIYDDFSVVKDQLQSQMDDYMKILDLNLGY